MITTTTIFWTQISSILVFVGASFALYRTLVQQKDATIQLLKENIAFLKDKLAEAKSQTPDILAQNLASRVKLLEEELRRIEKDKSSTQEQVDQKENELRLTRDKAKELAQKILHAQEMLLEFMCPKCGAPLVRRSTHTELVEHEGRDLDVDHEHIAFECGFELVDGNEVGKCSQEIAPDEF
jgi:predicted nuclease with TOPRIM domain